MSEDSDSKEVEEEEEPTHDGIEQTRELVNDMAKVQYEEYSDYQSREGGAKDTVLGLPHGMISESSFYLIS